MLTAYHCSLVDFKKICQIFDLKFNHNKEVHNVQRIKGYVWCIQIWRYGYLMIQFGFSICCLILFLISFLWPVIWMAAFKGLVRHFNLFSINWSRLGCVNVCIVNLDFIYLHRFDVVRFTCGVFFFFFGLTCGVLIKANLFLFLFFNHSVLFPLLFSCF